MTTLKIVTINRSLATVLSLLLLEYTFYLSCFVRGEVDENCKLSECECCVNNHCGQGYYFPNECKSGCIDGHLGVRCYSLCIDGCKSCQSSADKCRSCYDGFYLAQTDCNKCPSNCKTCSSSTNCTTCKVGFQHSASSRTCDLSVCSANCECNQGDCISCNNGYYDTNVSCNNKCPINCVSCVSSEECGECKNGYYNGYGLYGGNNILFNNCTHRCRNTCVNCSSYDECLHCPTGRYGSQCQDDCSAGCKDNICLIKTGQCDCSVNFSGEMCSYCQVGRFGENCEQNCPAYCKDHVCDKLSGHCIEGCITDGMTGDKCNECIIGMYGDFCDRQCPINCISKKCRKESGLCTDGCNNNFNGSTCEDCIKSKYGTGCKLDCPRTCVDNVCNKETGSCFSCVANFVGDKCNQCILGLFGEDCDINCSPNCFNDTCDKNKGTCDFGCKREYSGDKCCVDNDNCIHCSSNTKCRECKTGYFQTRCEDRCPVNCFGSCEFSTGFCKVCITDKFGSFCNLTCSENCNVSNSRYTSKCASHDGGCTFGCKDGFFGRTCNQPCKIYCIDNVCKQESGICLKGCSGSYDDPLCEGETPDKTSDNSSTLVAKTATFATLFALTTTALCILTMKKIVRKMRSAHKPTQESEFQIHFESSLAGNEGDIADSVDETVAYEVIDRTKDAHEHVYEAANQNTTERTVNAGNKQYENLHF